MEKKKNKGTKMPKGSQNKAEGSQVQESLDVSSIERASVLDGEPQNTYGNPLHSTAVEEDLSVPEEQAKAGRRGTAKRGGGGGRRRGGAAAGGSPRETPDTGGEEKRGRKRKSVGEKRAPGPRGRTEAGKENKRVRGVSNRPSSSQTPSPDPKRIRSRKSTSSRSADRRPDSAGRKSSSDGGPPGTDRPRARGSGSAAVLGCFLSICETYKESVESTAVRHAIDTFSSTIEKQITETFTTSNQFRVLKRDNAKVNSLIQKKTRRLLAAKYEMFSAEQQLSALRKDREELGQRLAHLKKGCCFLNGVRGLSKRYLAHRGVHPREKEQYGLSSLPALLLETKTILQAEDHLRNINNRLETRMKNQQM